MKYAYCTPQVANLRQQLDVVSAKLADKNKSRQGEIDEIEALLKVAERERDMALQVLRCDKISIHLRCMSLTICNQPRLMVMFCRPVISWKRDNDSVRQKLSSCKRTSTASLKSSIAPGSLHA